MSQHYEEAMERRQDKKLADELGLTTEELLEAPFDISEDEGSSGTAYGLLVTFSEHAAPHVLAKINGLEDGRMYRLPLSFFDEQESEDD